MPECSQVTVQVQASIILVQVQQVQMQANTPVGQYTLSSTYKSDSVKCISIAIRQFL